ncbi:uracil-DNA glycosylase [Streptomyces avidinii]
MVLGGTAGKALLGNAFRVSEQRGVLRSLPDRESADAGPSRAGRPAVSGHTLHPSAVLRAPDREAAYQGLLADLRAVTEALG